MTTPTRRQRAIALANRLFFPPDRRKTDKLKFLGWLLLVVGVTLGYFKLDEAVDAERANTIRLERVVQDLRQVDAAQRSSRREGLIRVCEANNVQNDAISVILQASQRQRPAGSPPIPPSIQDAIDALRPEPDCEGEADRILALPAGE